MLKNISKLLLPAKNFSNQFLGSADTLRDVGTGPGKASADPFKHLEYMMTLWVPMTIAQDIVEVLHRNNHFQYFQDLGTGTVGRLWSRWTKCVHIW